MLGRLLCWLLLLTVQAPLLAVEQPQPVFLHVLAYHDVRDEVAGDVDADQYATSTANLVSHFQWLRVHGFIPVSMEQVLRARAGVERLPEKAVLLTFDDGFKSAYTHVLPLLELFEYPAVLSVVTSWIESDHPGVVQAGRQLTRADFLSWDELRALQRSGLVEIASHSHDLHRGIKGNPQGNEQPAAVTRAYADGGYEDDSTYRARISRDLAASSRLITEQTGRAPRVIVWPYGARNNALTEAAHKLGMSVSLTLSDGRNVLLAGGEQLTLGRHLMRANSGVEALATALLHEQSPAIVRAAQVDLDYVYDEDPLRQESNLGLLLERIKALGISHVFLQAFADPDADGGAQQLYFPNRHLPVRADLFNRAAWQLKTRANVRVYAWLPLLSFEGTGIDPSWRVLQLENGTAAPDASSEPRLSPFEARARALIRDIYVDLAAHANFDGLLFHDDGRLNELEDANPAALAAARAAFGADFSIDSARRNAELGGRWAAVKSRALIDLSNELTAAVRELRPEVLTARNLFASALLDATAERYLAQRLDDYLRAYDHVALMAMPHLEGAHAPRAFYQALASAVGGTRLGLDKTIFELQTVDWQTGRRVDARELERTMRALQALGVRHLAYYPDNFIEGEPALAPLRRGISLATSPAEAPR